MKVTITSEERLRRKVLVDSHELYYIENQAVFWMYRPRGDDWLQQVRSNFDFTALVVESRDQEMIVTFKMQQEAQDFENWLLYANREADEGYSTMRG